MADIIKVQNLSKSYGDKNVLNNVSFSFKSGQIIGLLGPNGSGKTTLIKILTGLIQDYKGEVLVDGDKPGYVTKSKVAFLPDRNFLPAWMTPKDAINYMADFYADFDKVRALEFLETFDLPIKQKIKTMSKGMQEKMHLLLVMSRKAKLYVLDEPLGGVDPAARDFIIKTIMANHAEGSSVLISTHLIYDVENVFDSILMIGRGQVLANGDSESFKKEYGTIENLFKETFKHDWQVD